MLSGKPRDLKGKIPLPKYGGRLAVSQLYGSGRWKCAVQCMPRTSACLGPVLWELDVLGKEINCPRLSWRRKHSYFHSDSLTVVHLLLWYSLAFNFIHFNQRSWDNLLYWFFSLKVYKMAKWKSQCEMNTSTSHSQHRCSTKPTTNKRDCVCCGEWDTDFSNKKLWPFFNAIAIIGIVYIQLWKISE